MTSSSSPVPKVKFSPTDFNENRITSKTVTAVHKSLPADNFSFIIIQPKIAENGTLSIRVTVNSLVIGTAVTQSTMPEKCAPDLKIRSHKSFLEAFLTFSILILLLNKTTVSNRAIETLPNSCQYAFKYSDKNLATTATTAVEPATKIRERMPLFFSFLNINSSCHPIRNKSDQKSDDASADCIAGIMFAQIKPGNSHQKCQDEKEPGPSFSGL